MDFEFPSLYEKLTGRENLRFFASLYPNTAITTSCLKASGFCRTPGRRSRINRRDEGAA